MCSAQINVVKEIQFESLVGRSTELFLTPLDNLLVQVAVNMVVIKQ